MIIGGKYRTNGRQLGEYLGDYLKADKNDRVEMIELTGSAFRGLTKSIASWEAESIGSRCKNALWHAHLRTPADEHLTREQQIEAVNILERHLGFVGQPRAIVIHENDGHEHVHVVWSRIRREDEILIDKNGKKTVKRAGTAKETSFTKKKNCAAAREIEERFGLTRVDSPDFKKDGDRRKRREESKKAPDQGDYAKAKRSKLDPIERQRTITALWQQTDSGKALQAALLDAGYVLARGDRRSFVVVDKAGDVHSLARQIKIKGILKEQVDARLADLDPASVPRAKHIQLEMWRAKKEREAEAQMHSADPAGLADALKQTPALSPAQRTRKSDGERELDPLDPAVILRALTKGQSTFTKGNLFYEIGKRLQKQNGAAEPAKVAQIADRVRKLDDLITLGPDRVGSTRYTSRDMLETELAMRDNSDYLASLQRHGVFRKIRDAAPSAAKLGTEQREAFEHVTKEAALSIVIGYAGTGKSTMLGAAREAWEAAGYRVRGVALSGMAAQSLQEGSGIESRTLASLFLAMEKLPEQQMKLAQLDGRIAAIAGKSFAARRARSEMQANRDQFSARVDALRFTSRDVIVLDEAAMVGSRQMNQLLEAARAAKAKVVLVGDAEQLQAIDAGGAFRALTDRNGAVKISEIRRQKEDWAKAATKDFGDGFTSEALVAYREKGHIHELTGHTAARDRIIGDWTASRQANPNDSHLMLAFTRDDVAMLNQKAREAYKGEGRLGIDQFVRTEAGLKEFARGDRLYFLQNDSRLKVKNGSLGTVEKIEPSSLQDSNHLTVKLDNGQVVRFSTADYAKFSHGYAATIHKSQGATANRAHVLASQFMDRHAAYVAMSRHIEQADLYYSAAEFKTFDGLVKSLSRDRRKDTTLDYLDRAEKVGQREKFLRRARKVVEILTKEERQKRAFDRLAEAIRLRTDPAARAEHERKKEAERAARKLRDILGERPDKKKRAPGVGISL